MDKKLYQVQEIIGRRIFSGKVLYLVKWLGYPKEEATWESVKVLSNVKHLIKAFNEKDRNGNNVDDDFNMSVNSKNNSFKTRQKRKFANPVDDDEEQYRIKTKDYKAWGQAKKKPATQTFKSNLKNKYGKKNSKNDQSGDVGFGGFSELKKKLQSATELPSVKHFKINNQNFDQKIKLQHQEIQQILKQVEGFSDEQFRNLGIFDEEEEQGQQKKHGIENNQEKKEKVSGQAIVENKMINIDQISSCIVQEAHTFNSCLAQRIEGKKQILKPLKVIKGNNEILSRSISIAQRSFTPIVDHLSNNKVSKIFFLERTKDYKMIYLVEYANLELKKLNTEEMMTRHPKQFVGFIEHLLVSKLML